MDDPFGMQFKQSVDRLPDVQSSQGLRQELLLLEEIVQASISEFQDQVEFLFVHEEAVEGQAVLAFDIALDLHLGDESLTQLLAHLRQIDLFQSAHEPCGSMLGRDNPAEPPLPNQPDHLELIYQGLLGFEHQRDL